MLSAQALVVLAAGIAGWPAADHRRSRLDWMLHNRLPTVTGPRGDPVALQAPGARDPQRHRSAQVCAALGTGRTVFLCLGVVGPVLALHAEGPIPALLVLLAVAVAGRIVRRYRTERDHELARRELSGAVSALTDECAAGAGLAAALAATATVAGRYGQDFLAAAAQARSGEDVVAAWRARPELADVAAAYGLAARTGAPLASVLASVTNDLEADSALHSAVAAILAGPRSSAGLLAMLPVLGIALGFAMGAHPQRVLLHTRWGLADLVAGIAFDVAGVGWTMAIARRAER